METSREKYYIMNTMLCLLKFLEGKVTTVETRGEKTATGKIISVDGYMNITMENVTFWSLTMEKKFDKFFVNGKIIRYVHIPDEVNIKYAMDTVLKRMCSRTASLRVRQEIKDKAWQKLQQNERMAMKEMKRAEQLKD